VCVCMCVCLYFCSCVCMFVCVCWFFVWYVCICMRMRVAKTLKHTPGLGKATTMPLRTGWRRYTRCLKLQVSFCKRATHYKALLWKMTCKDKAFFESSPTCSRFALWWIRFGVNWLNLYTYTNMHIRINVCICIFIFANYADISMFIDTHIWKFMFI